MRVLSNLNTRIQIAILCTYQFCDQFHILLTSVRVEEGGPVRGSYKTTVAIYQYCVTVHTWPASLYWLMRPLNRYVISNIQYLSNNITVCLFCLCTQDGLYKLRVLYIGCAASIFVLTLLIFRSLFVRYYNLYISVLLYTGMNMQLPVTNI